MAISLGILTQHFQTHPYKCVNVHCHVGFFGGYYRVPRPSDLSRSGCWYRRYLWTVLDAQRSHWCAWLPAGVLRVGCLEWLNRKVAGICRQIFEKTIVLLLLTRNPWIWALNHLWSKFSSMSFFTSTTLQRLRGKTNKQTFKKKVPGKIVAQSLSSVSCRRVATFRTCAAASM